MARWQRAASRAAQLVALWPQARGPALRSLTAPALTPREREDGLPAAQGLSNSAIADRLHLSERTVESHLYRASEKLGVTDRGQVGNALT